VTIPTTSKRVRLDLLHPKMLTRLEHFFADGRIAGNVAVVSGVRSYADQKRLYRKYKAGTGNLAANPDRRFGPPALDGKGIWRGSWHMQQGDGYGHAVDFRIVGKGITTQEVNRIATSFGLRPTVKSEWWHHQWRSSSSDEFPAPALENARSETVETPAMDWAGIAAAVEKQKRQAARVPLKKGARGDAVRTLQIMLGHAGFDAGTPDGVFGKKTTRAVKAFQKSRRLIPDGIAGGKTFNALFT
jgi:hypothetical protein